MSNDKDEEAVAPEKHGRIKKTFVIIAEILFVCFFAVCIFALFASVTAKRSPDGAVNFFGYEMRTVLSDSMEKCDETDVSGFEIKDIPVKSLVFTEAVPTGAAAEEWYANLKVGDVLTFRYVYDTQVTITHRITEITEKETGGYIIVLQGDNRSSENGVLSQTIDTSQDGSPNYVIGKVVFNSYFLGLAITAVKQPVGIVLLVIVPSAVIMVMEIIRIVGMLTEKKREQAKREAKRKEDEIEELKRQLAQVNAELGKKQSINSDEVSE
ncbi:MAG: hypothetical protein ACI4S9_04105 [Christensenellales bacterium]